MPRRKAKARTWQRGGRAARREGGERFDALRFDHRNPTDDDRGTATAARKWAAAGVNAAAFGVDASPYSALFVIADSLKLVAAVRAEITRVGGHSPMPIDVRVLAATNRDLPAMIAEKPKEESAGGGGGGHGGGMGGMGGMM